MVKSVYVPKAGGAGVLELGVCFPSEPGRYPVIVFSHGAWGCKDDYQLLTRFWASHGYVCIQPNHYDATPIGSEMQASGFGEWASRPADLIQILDSLEQLGARIPLLGERIAHDRIGVGGHSYGAGTAQMLGGVSVERRQGRVRMFRDERVRAVVLISPQGPGQLHSERSWRSLAVPMLAITGTQDRARNGQDYQWRLLAYRLAPPGHKYALLIDGAGHDMGGLSRGSAHLPNLHDEEHAGLVQDASLQFWEIYLKDQPQTLEAAAVLNGRAGRFVKG